MTEFTQEEKSAFHAERMKEDQLVGVFMKSRPNRRWIDVLVDTDTESTAWQVISVAASNQSEDPSRLIIHSSLTGYLISWRLDIMIVA